MGEELTKGTTFGNYRIEAKLGEGGMGEVYLAEDTRLFRKVALKILPSEVAGKSDRMQRFEQEARAASALNHPNILTIYEIGEMEGTRFIATEFVDGDTLRGRLAAGQVDLERTLEYAIQAASALAAAHEAGIVHRDIKPENIMVRGDGLVKVLDFGLAKLGSSASDIDSEGETRAQVQTEPGVIMGTVRYMSPEQARGKPVDARTDIWSLGCVIYEMASGEAPFRGETTADLIAEIVKAHPAPLTDIDPGIPDRLDEIVSKCIEKDREERYQVVKDLAIDLRRLKKKVEVQADVERSATPERTVESAAVRTKSLAGEQTSSAPGSVATVSSTEVLSGAIRTHKVGAFVAVVLILTAFAGVGYLGYRVWSTPTQQASGKSMQITRLTTTGQAGAVSISADGRYIVHSDGDPTNRGLWVRQTTTGSAVQIVPNRPGTYQGTTFSPDNDHIYYAWSEPRESSATLYSIPTLGGSPTLILNKIDGPVSFSPDGKRFAFVRRETDLVIANADGTGERLLHKIENSATYWFSNAGPAWSPDGKTIAVSRGSSSTGRLGMSVVGISADDGSEVPLTDKTWTGSAHRVVWTPDGSGVIVNASEAPRGTQVWFLPFPKGEARRVTNDLRGYGSFSLGITADGSTIATVEEDSTSQLWAASPGDDDASAVQLNSGKNDGEGVAIAPDGRIVFVRNAGDTTDLWIMNADGTDPRQLTKDKSFEYSPVVSPDGRTIVYVSDRAGLPHIWSMGIDGNEPRQLSFGNDFDDNNPQISPDGKWVVYNSWKTGKYSPWRVSIDGGEPEQLYPGTATAGPISPDSKNVLCQIVDENGPRTSADRIGLVPLEPGGSVSYLEIDPAFDISETNWIGDTVYLSRNGIPGNVFGVASRGGPFKQLTKFKTKMIFSTAVSADGKRFVVSRGQITNDVVLIKDFR